MESKDEKRGAERTKCKRGRIKPVSKVHGEGLAAHSLVVFHQLCHDLRLLVAHQEVVILRGHVDGKEVVGQFAEADGAQVLSDGE